MDAPNDELKGLAGQALPVESADRITLEWINLFLNIPIAKRNEVYTHSPLLIENLHIVSGDCMIGDHLLMQFVVDIHSGSTDVGLMVYVMHDGTAKLEHWAIGGSGPIEPDPEFLQGTGILGFKGTWEQVLRKLIELNDLVAKQISEAPADMKKQP